MCASQHSQSHSVWRLVAANAKPVVVLNDGILDLHIYCIHSVTGDVGGLELFARRFACIKIYGIQIPKREMTFHLGSSVEEIAAHHVELIEAFQPDGVISLIGWSAGAVIALEIAQQLCARGREVPLIVALDGVPCNTGAGLSASDPRYVLRMIANLPRWFRDDRKSSDWSLSGIRRRLAEKVAARRGSGQKSAADIATLDADTVDRLIRHEGWSPTQKEFVYTMYRSLASYIPRKYSGQVLVFEMRT